MKTLIEKFAETHRLKTRIDREDGTTIIPGKNGRSHIYEYADDVLAFALMPSVKSNQWGCLINRLTAPMFQIVQRGDFEGCVIFDHPDPEAVKLVKKVCRIHPRRLLSPATIEAMRKRLPSTRRKATFPARNARQVGMQSEGSF